MKQQIFSLGKPAIVEIGHRADLAKSDVQLTLRSFHGRPDIYCGCGHDHGLLAKLVIRAIGREKFTVVRENVQEHLESCCLNREGDESDETLVCCEGIFAPPIAKDADRTMSPSSLEKWKRLRYDTFSRYARRVFSRGLSMSFVKAFEERGRLVNPTVEFVMRGMDSAIQEILFENKLSGYATAEKHGCRLRFGFVFDSVTESKHPVEAFNVFWWDGCAFSTGVVTTQSLAMEAAVADLVILSQVQARPYFVLAVQDKSGCLSRLFFHQVMVNGDVVIPLDSSTEGVVAAAKIAAGSVLLKPVKVEDTQWALAQLGIVIPGEKKWECSPDFVEVREGNVFFTEVRGFKQGINRRYDERLKWKAGYYRSLFRDSPNCYEEIDGTLLRRSTTLTRPESWKDVAIHFELLPGGLFREENEVCLNT